MASGDTVRGDTAVETWTSFVKAALGMLGLALLAVGPLVPRDSAFQYLPQYAFVAGAILVLVAATMRLRSMLIVVGCIALTAGLACTLVGGADPRINLAALMLYSAAAVILGAAGRHIGMAIPFLLVPLLIVAPYGPGWGESREAFGEAWEDAVGCPCLLAGLPAGLAVVGAVIGHLRTTKWVPVRPSALPVVLASAGILLASLIVASLLPDQYAFVRLVCMRAAVLAGVLGWIAVAYHVGRVALVWEAATACLLFLAGALFLDRQTQFPEAFGATLGITIAASLVPAALAGMGLLVRRWIGKERPATAPPTAKLKTWDEAEQRAFFTAATTAPALPAPDGPTKNPQEPTQGDDDSPASPPPTPPAGPPSGP